MWFTWNYCCESSVVDLLDARFPASTKGRSCPYNQAQNAMLVPILFFCSGATALVYEVVWSKYLTQMLGSTVQAQTVVLAVFMGGLALGNRLFGRRSDAATRPLALYGYIEIALGLY